MAGLATVLTEQGMEGITAFTPPPKQFAKAAAPVVAALEDEEAQASRGVWIVAGAVLAVLLVLAVGYWIVSRFTDAPRRPAAATASRPIMDKSEPVPEPSPQLAEPGKPPVPAASSMQEAASGVAAPAPPVPSSRASRTSSAQAHKQQPSVFVANPEWKSQVRRIGNVDAETERSAMTVLDAIHQAQERERQPQSPSRSAASGSQQ